MPPIGPGTTSGHLVLRLQPSPTQKVRIVSIVFSKVKTLIAREKPLTQKSKSLITPTVTISKIINEDLQLKKSIKHNVQRILPSHVVQRKTFNDLV